MFCFGDLNFRIADHGLHFIRSSINSGRVNLLWTKDQVGRHATCWLARAGSLWLVKRTDRLLSRPQLTMMKSKEAFLQEFEEGPLNFKPTYKFDRNGDTYDTR